MLQIEYPYRSKIFLKDLFMALLVSPIAGISGILGATLVFPLAPFAFLDLTFTSELVGAVAPVAIVTLVLVAAQARRRRWPRNKYALACAGIGNVVTIIAACILTSLQGDIGARSWTGHPPHVIAGILAFCYLSLVLSVGSFIGGFLCSMAFARCRNLGQ